MSENLKLLESLLIALALGILIGAERGIARICQNAEERKTFAGIIPILSISSAFKRVVIVPLQDSLSPRSLYDIGYALLTNRIGIRTFALISLVGALSLYFARYFERTFFVASFFGFILLVITAYIITSKIEKDVRTTTEITAILTFLYGALCMTEYRLVAIVLAIFTTVILYTKKPAHSFVGQITEEEFYLSKNLPPLHEFFHLSQVFRRARNQRRQWHGH